MLRSARRDSRIVKKQAPQITVSPFLKPGAVENSVRHVAGIDPQSGANVGVNTGKQNNCAKQFRSWHRLAPRRFSADQTNVRWLWNPSLVESKIKRGYSKC